ncbi:MAG: hypothetical protein ACRCXZ_04515 [Patescibacteria group bacterium]
MITIKVVQTTPIKGQNDTEVKPVYPEGKDLCDAEGLYDDNSFYLRYSFESLDDWQIETMVLEFSNLISEWNSGGKEFLQNHLNHQDKEEVVRLIQNQLNQV